MFDQSTTSRCVQIPIVEDDVVENNENFTVMLDTPDDVNLMPDRGTVTITDTTGTIFSLYFCLSPLYSCFCCSMSTIIAAIIPITELTPEFEQPEYSVPEDEGPAEVCVVVPAGQVERETVLQLVTQPGTATSEAILRLNCPPNYS